MTLIDSSAKIVATARKTTGLSQSAFGKMIGRGQSLVSKYERGQVEPPGHVVMRCMNILGDSRPHNGGVSSLDVARLIESRLEGNQFSKLRAALVDLIESLSAAPRTQRRRNT